MAIKIALAGNPNCGKTTMFNALTGANQYVGNWPGVTVEKKEGKLKGKRGKGEEIIVTDLPGIYSLSPYTLEEVVSRDYILKENPDVIIDLVDATNIERNLYLTTQLIETGVPVVIALNMADLLEKRGIKIDTKRLSMLLDCPIIETSALKGEGLDKLIDEAVKTAKKSSVDLPKEIFTKEMETAITAVKDILPSSVTEDKKRWYAVKFLENDEKVKEAMKLSASGQSLVDARRQELEKQLAEIESLLSDFNREMSGYLGDLTFDDYEFEQIEKRLDEINRLKVKYGQSIEEILAYREEKEQRLEELQNYDSYVVQLQKSFEEQETLLRDNAKEMSLIRKQYASQLAGQIRAELADLNFLETNFDLEVTESAPLSANGFDEACFLISMNPGSPMRMLGDVASGGELSRIMLAIKTVLADKDQTETLIFDEIDVGISGRTAQKVSEKMAVIARSRQVLCITHLAQIASMADHHFYIEKNVHDGITETSIRELSLMESEEELARILGGAQITETTLKSAREMKEMADATKKY